MSVHQSKTCRHLKQRRQRLNCSYPATPCGPHLPCSMATCVDVKSVTVSWVCMQVHQQAMSELDEKLTRIADFGEELKQLKTRHEMTAAQNANMFVKLEVR